MARNKFTDVSTLEIEKITNEIMANADLKTTASVDERFTRGGRKPKDVKADKLVRVYITEPQKTALEKYCEKTGISESSLVKQLLIKEGVF